MKLLHLKRQKTVQLLFGIFFISLLIPVSTSAQDRDIFFTGDDLNATITSRLDHRDAEFAMTTQEGSVDLMLTENTILIQFSDQFFNELDDEIRNEDDYDEASLFADVITSMVSTGVQKLLNRALAIPLSEIQEVYYSNGKLYIFDRSGEEIFGDLDINDVYIMEDFSRRDARRFVSNAEKRMM